MRFLKKMSKISAGIQGYETKREDIRPDEPSIQDQLDAAKAEIRELKAQVESLKIYKFGLERFSGDIDSITFYTEGFQVINIF